MTQIDYDQNSFFQVSEPEPHRIRRKEILANHPQVKTLFGSTPSTFIYVSLVVASQLAVALLLKSQPWWMILVVSYLFGAIANHALFVFIHEATHNLIFKGVTANRVAAIVANLAIGFPVAMGFRKYHLLHHKHQGELSFDADLPTVNEARMVGASFFKKSFWLFIFVYIEGVVRPGNLKNVKLMDKWVVVNTVVMVAFAAASIGCFGYKPLSYLLISTAFSVGLHPLGARWIQEHFVFRPGQETYSYYGPANIVTFNVGYHNEHHDFMTIPWSRLPDLRAMAPEFYDNLYFHTSYTKLLFAFLKHPSVTLFSRVIRPSRIEAET